MYGVQINSASSTYATIRRAFSKRPVASRGDTLNCPQLTVTLDSPAEGIIGVTIEHWDQSVPEPRFRLAEGSPEVSVASADGWSTLTSGTLTAALRETTPWQLDFRSGGRVLTSSTERSIGALTVAGEGHFVREQLTIAPGEHLYGLGERFGPQRVVGTLIVVAGVMALRLG